MEKWHFSHLYILCCFKLPGRVVTLSNSIFHGQHSFLKKYVLISHSQVGWDGINRSTRYSHPSKLPFLSVLGLMLMKLKFTIFKFAKQNPTPPEPRNCVRLWGNAMKSGNDLPKSLKNSNYYIPVWS